MILFEKKKRMSLACFCLPEAKNVNVVAGLDV